MKNTIDSERNAAVEEPVAAQEIREIPLALIDSFPDHPFQVRNDADMIQLVESVQERGVITPATVRAKDDGRYELVSGHRRKQACALAGMDTLRCEVVALTREEAVILMVESNFQRSQILPSEKAFAYKMRLDAMSKQAGRPKRENASPVATHFSKGRSDVKLAELVGESKDQIRRYIRLTNLVPELLQFVDDGRIAFRPAVELSYLSKDEQRAVVEAIAYNDATPSLAQAVKLKKFAQEGKLSAEVVESIMSEEKPNQREKIHLRYDEARRYIPENISYNETGAYILKALEYYHRYRERQRQRREER